VQQTFPGLFPGPSSLADLDGDGKPDLVLGVQQSSGVSGSLVWLKNTGGGFAPPTTLVATTPGNNKHFAIADFNGDGKLDILYSLDGSPASFHLLLNQGNAQFTDQAVAALNGIVGIPIAIDFNLDHIPDVVVAVPTSTGAQLYSFAGNGNGTFTQVASISTPPLGQLVVGDFDHDGFHDLAGPGVRDPARMTYFFGDGHGNFSQQQVVGPEGQFAAVCDFNGDGIPDVVVPDNISFVSLSLGRKNRNFSQPLALTPALVTGVATGDINGDGLPEIFAAGFSESSTPGTIFCVMSWHKF
jgi:hypothetical protein